MARSLPVNIRNKNFLTINHLAPYDSIDSGLNIYADKTSSTVVARFSSSTSKLQIDEITELTAASGITVDGVLIKDGSILLNNNVNLQIKNNGGVAQNIFKIATDNSLSLSSLWNTSSVRTALGLSGISSDGTTIALDAGTPDLYIGSNTIRSSADQGIDLGSASYRFYRTYTAKLFTDNITDDAGFLTLDCGSYDVILAGDSIYPHTDKSLNLGTSGHGFYNGYISRLYTDKINYSAAPIYSVSHGSPDRSLDVTENTLAQVAAVLGTLLADLKTAGLVK